MTLKINKIKKNDQKFGSLNSKKKKNKKTICYSREIKQIYYAIIY